MQLKKLKVKVELRKKTTVAAVKGFAPAAVVVAIGSTPSTKEQRQDYKFEAVFDHP
jgi:hypothetical protein